MEHLFIPADNEHDQAVKEPPTTDRAELAEQAMESLRDIVHAADVSLPSMSVDGCVCGFATQNPLVQLGSVRPEVAARIAELMKLGLAVEADES
ncbi:hypothetical protein [Streptomyces phytohabitans]|uniref:hypothetical protein n=1 Tax=Streptomyces phytohabitans TaxID=1150371 RepID=UPI00345C25A4